MDKSSEALPSSELLTDQANEECRKLLGLDRPQQGRRQGQTKTMSSRTAYIASIRESVEKRRAALRKGGTPPSSPRSSRQTIFTAVPSKPAVLDIELYGIHKAVEDKDIRRIGDDSISLLNTILTLAPEATNIELQKNDLTGIGAQRLCQYLARHKHLEKLNMTSNKALFSEVTRLPAHSNHFSGWLGAEAFTLLLKKHPRLFSLSLGACGLNDVGASILASGLSENETLVFLDLGYNDFGDSGIVYICRALERHKTLSHLLIDGNKLTDQSSDALLVLLEQNPRISILEVNDNDFSEEIANRIKERAQQNWDALETNTNNPPETQAPNF